MKIFFFSERLTHTLSKPTPKSTPTSTMSVEPSTRGTLTGFGSSSKPVSKWKRIGSFPNRLRLSTGSVHSC
ncbi:hypothetical protein Hanom_Chr04g00312781 [Helianthus anomalus]